MNVDEMQKKLSQKAEEDPEHQFENLYGLLEAYPIVKTKKSDK